MGAVSNFRVEILLICLLISIVVWFIYKKTKPSREKRRIADFLKKNPTAGRLFLQDRGMQIIMLNGKDPYAQIEHGEYVAFLKAGENIVDVVYQQGGQNKAMEAKDALSMVENAKISFLAQSNKKYRLLYSPKTKSFEIEEE